MSQTVVARFLGAGLAAAAITTVILTDWQQCGSIAGRGWVLTLTPAVVAAIYTLPRPEFAAYFRNGLAAVLGIAIVAGNYGSVVQSPSSCELIYAGADGYFVFWGFWALILLVLGAVPFGALVLGHRGIKRYRATRGADARPETG